VYDEEKETAQKAFDDKVKEFQLKEMELKLEEKRKDIALKGKVTPKAVKK
jgi:hypothetical protein